MILRCTTKMLKLLSAHPKDLATVQPSEQDWYANLLWLDGRKCLLLAHAGTLFSVFIPNVRKADLVPIGVSVVGYIHNELKSESLPPDSFGVLDTRSVTLAKTESRPVLGYMNEMVRFCEYAVDDAGGLARCDTQELNRALRRELHLSRRAPGYFVPIELVAGPSVPRGRPPLRVVE